MTLTPGDMMLPKRTKTKPAMLSNQVYDIFKLVATVGLPGIGTLYFALAQIWGFPAAEQVVGTIAALNVFFGLLLQIATKTYNGGDVKYDGDVEVTTADDGKKKYLLNLNGDPEDLANKQAITFRVQHK